MLVEIWDEHRIALVSPRRPILGATLVASSAPLFGGGVFAFAFAAEHVAFGVIGVLFVIVGALLLGRAARALFDFPFALDTEQLAARGGCVLSWTRALPLSAIDHVELRLTFYRGAAGAGFVGAAILVHDRARRTLLGPKTDRTTVAGWQALRDELFPLAAEIAHRAGATLRLTGKGTIPNALLHERRQ